MRARFIFGAFLSFLSFEILLAHQNLEDKENAQQVSPLTTSGKKVKISEGRKRVNFRKYPNTQAPILAQYDAGEAFEVIAGSSEWTQVQNKDGQVGFISKQFLSPILPEKESSQLRPRPTPQSETQIPPAEHKAKSESENSEQTVKAPLSELLAFDKNSCIPFDSEKYSPEASLAFLERSKKFRDPRSNVKEKKKNFFNYFVPLAKWLESQTGVPSSVMLAQWIQESGWGLSDLVYGTAPHYGSGRPTFNIMGQGCDYPKRSERKSFLEELAKDPKNSKDIQNKLQALRNLRGKEKIYQNKSKSLSLGYKNNDPATKQAPTYDIKESCWEWSGGDKVFKVGTQSFFQSALVYANNLVEKGEDSARYTALRTTIKSKQPKSLTQDEALMGLRRGGFNEDPDKYDAELRRRINQNALTALDSLKICEESLR